MRVLAAKRILFFDSPCAKLYLAFFFSQKAFKALCQSTHLYGRRLVLEWAQMEEGIDEIRKRTAKHFYQGKRFFSYLPYFNKSSLT